MADATVTDVTLKDPELRRYIEENLERIMALFSPHHLIAFGSRVQGNPKPESDIDLIVVSDVFEGVPFLKRSRMFNEAIVWDIRVDAWCYTVKEFERLRRQVGIVSDACREGIWILKGEFLPDEEVCAMTIEEQAQMWVRQGERELDRARRLYTQDDFDGAVVSAQQAAEKFLKALYIVRFQATPPRTHDLTRLAVALDAPANLVSIGKPLTEDYFRARYPDLAGAVPYEVFDAQIAQERIQQAEQILEWVRQQLGSL
ncbi:MAG: HEPN domain-containing protein [Armatimonadota bacterium]